MSVKRICECIVHDEKSILPISRDDAQRIRQKAARLLQHAGDSGLRPASRPIIADLRLTKRAGEIAQLGQHAEGDIAGKAIFDPEFPGAR